MTLLKPSNIYNTLSITDLLCIFKLYNLLAVVNILYDILTISCDRYEDDDDDYDRGRGASNYEDDADSYHDDRRGYDEYGDDKSDKFDKKGAPVPAPRPLYKPKSVTDL